MKGTLDRTKVVVRHLPPTISQSNFIEQIDSRFSGRYRWLSFRPGKSSQKHITYSRASIDFNKSDDVIEFAEFFNGHVFVNEKGTQYETIVEYAPSQRVPRNWSKNDGREGTILKDPEYLEFLDCLAKPAENLPSAEVQLERKEAERVGAPKDTPIVTPLMEYVRQKRAARGGARRTILNGKPARKISGMLTRNTGSGSSRGGSEKRTSTMYVLRESSKGASSKDKSSSIPVFKHDEQRNLEKSVNSAAISRTDSSEGECGGSGSSEIGKQKILLRKGKEKETSNQNAASPANNSHSPVPTKQNHRRESNDRIIKSVLNRDIRQNQTLSGSQSEHHRNSNQDREKKPPRPTNVQSFQKNTNGSPEGKVASHESQAFHTEKEERRTRNRDRPDRGVWAPIRRSDGSHASDESLSSSTFQTPQVVDFSEDMKNDVLIIRGGEFRNTGSGRGGHNSAGNGSYRQGGRRGSAYNIKDADGSQVEGKFPKRGGSSGHVSSEVLGTKKTISSSYICPADGSQYYRSAVGLVFMESAAGLAMETSKVESAVRNQAEAKYLSIIKEEGLEISQPALASGKSEVHECIITLQFAEVD
ncbi:hypothetical protein F511_10324 [Dorcoceras hygrometricum]|uniref:UPF3 domain-containing protein n=1 Tax=Dorcoceras hygrometricum TaxID=472368 RepID=A0A2Z7CPD5_9LAMI|nr:hypothetical protein F511_10324 [Dorcoceras hygrometricum]